MIDIVLLECSASPLFSLESVLISYLIGKGIGYFPFEHTLCHYSGFKSPSSFNDLKNTCWVCGKMKSISPKIKIEASSLELLA